MISGISSTKQKLTEFKHLFRIGEKMGIVVSTSYNIVRMILENVNPVVKHEVGVLNSITKRLRVLRNRT